MADTIKINADVSNAIQQIDRLTQKVENFHNKFKDQFDKINNYAAGLAASLVATGAAVAAFADDIADIATANELAVSQVLALSKAMSENGGKADAVGQVLQRLSSNIESANSGNLKMVTTFGRLGVSMQELGSLSNSEIKDKLLASLAQIKDPMERNALATEVFGKAILGVDLKKLGSDAAELEAKMAPYAASIQDAADAWDNMQKIFGQIKMAFAEAFSPIFKFVKDLKVETDALVIAFRMLGAALVVMTGAAVLGGLAKLVELMKTLTVVVSKNPLITIAATLLSLGVGAATYLGLGKSIEEKEKDISKELEIQNKKKDDVKRNQTGLNDAVKKELDQLIQIRDNLDKNYKIALSKYDLELQSLSLGEDQKKLAEATAKIEEDSKNALIALRQKYDALDSDARARTKKAFEEEQDAIKKSSDAQKKAAEERITTIQRLQNALRDYSGASKSYGDAEVKIFESIAKAQSDLSGYSDRIALEEKLAAVTKIRESLTRESSKLSSEDARMANDAIIQATTNVALLQTQYSNMNAEIQKSIQQQVKTGEITQEVADKILQQSEVTRKSITNNAEKVSSTTKAISEQSRMFSTGWNKAFNDYIDNATNAAEQAKRVFQSMTTAMEDLLMNFFKTGKLGWKDFIQTVIDALMRSQIQQLVGKIMAPTAGAAGGGGLLGGAIIPGILAEGGPAAMNRPYIVGERGPELFVPASNGTVVPNSGLGGSTVVNYNISAVDAQSFKQMLARDPSFLYAVSEQGRRTLPGAA